MDKPITLGHSDGLQFSFAWADREPSGTAAEASKAEVRATVGGRLIWGDIAANGEYGVSWTWIELLEHLSENWVRLQWEEADPLGINSRPDRLRMDAQRIWGAHPDNIRTSQEEELWSYEQAHNLAAGLQGIWLPELWLVREGNNFRITAKGIEVHQPTTELLETLISLGKYICSRLEKLDDVRAKKAVQGWYEREKVPLIDRLVIATSLSQERLKAITGRKLLQRVWEITDVTNPQSELVAVARMIGVSLAPEKIASIMRHIASIPKSSTDKLDKLTGNLADTNTTIPQGSPYAQGSMLARKLRDQLENTDNRVYPEKLLQQHSVRVRTIDVKDAPQLEAFTCWGPNHGPAIFVNKRGKHSRGQQGKRATLAHELCHLIVDRHEGLPLAEVFGGRIPRDIESRANGFAAEFLMPGKIAVAEFNESTEPKRTLESLCSKFQASREIIAWQALNPELPPETREYLSKNVSRPAHYNAI